MDANDVIAPSRNILRDYPTRRVMPYDGMAVTAEVWEDALAHSRRLLQYHALLQHGYGIVAGLEVVASDPADTSVYIRPGAAVAPNGALIVITEPVMQPLNNAEGEAHLLLVYAESEPAYERAGAGAPGDRLWVNSGYYIEVVDELPAGPCIELARIRRASKTQPAYNAGNPLHPGEDEIDLRNRRNIAPAQPMVAGAGIVHFGSASTDVAAGLDALARSLRRAGVTLWVDDHVAPTSALGRYDLVYAAGHGAFQISADEMTSLYQFVQGGGTLMVESCRREADADKSDSAFRDMFESMGMVLEVVSAGHALLGEANLFGTLPDGFEGEAPAVQAGEGVVFSLADYASVWQGLRNGGAAGREAIRATHEWGENLIRLAAIRKAQF